MVTRNDCDVLDLAALHRIHQVQERLLRRILGFRAVADPRRC